MERGEIDPSVDKQATLLDIRQFLEAEASNQRFLSDSTASSYRAKTISDFEQALSEFINGRYVKAINLLEAYHGVRRYRADEEPDIEGSSTVDNRLASNLDSWIELLKSM